MTFTVVPGFRLHFDWSLLLTLTVILLLAIGLPAATTAQPSQGTQATSQKGTGNQEAMTLELGKSVEREMVGAQTQSYQIAMGANQYAKVTVDQRRVSVIVTLYGPDKQKLNEWMMANWRDESLTFSWLSNVAGDYQLEAQPRISQQRKWQHEVRLTELRAATSADAELVEAQNLYNQSIIARWKNQYDEAIPLLERALAIQERLLGSWHADVGQTLNLLGWFCYEDPKAQMARTEQYFRRAIAVRERALGPEHPATAWSINMLALMFDDAGELAQAAPLYQRALAIREKIAGPEHESVGQSLHNLAILHLQMGDYEKAEPLFLRALAIREKRYGDDDPTANTLNGLANLYVRQGRYGQAEPLLLRSLAILEKKFGAQHVTVTEALYSLGWLYINLPDYGKAEQYFQRTVKLMEQPGDHFRLNGALHNLGRVWFVRGDYVQAEAFFLRSLAAVEKRLGSEHNEASTREWLAWTYVMKQDVAAAIKYFTLSEASLERIIQPNLIVGSERQKFLFLNQYMGGVDRALTLHTQYAPNNEEAAKIALTGLLSFKGRTLDATNDNISRLRGRGAQSDQVLFDQLSGARAQWAKAALEGPGAAKPETYRERLKQLQDVAEKLETEIGLRSVEFRAQTKRVTLAAVQFAIPNNATLIEFAAYKPFDPSALKHVAARYAVYVLTAQGQPRWADLGEAAPIDQAVEAWRKALRDPKRTDVRRLARAVDEKVMRPVRALLGETKHLLIAPDGLLNLIPFEALVDERNRYLVESYSLSYLSSGRDLLRMQVARESGSEPMVMANPAFGNLKRAEVSTKKGSAKPGDRNDSEDLRGQFFGPLPGTAQEAAAIKRLFPQSRIFTEAQATEAELKKAVAPKILHVATHGFFLADQEKPPEDARGVLAEDPLRTPDARLAKLAANIENPLLRAGLAFAGANEGKSGPNGEDDGVLTAMEATTLNLWGTKLVVLSACDTGVGEVKNGEGVYGLRRAFVLAGAETLLMSLWPVSDKETKRLMIPYYSALKRGDGRGKALRQVQLQLIRSKNNRHPFYWAGFIQSGEWANLAGQR